MKKLLIFGLRDFSELAWYYFTHDSTYEVAGFSVTKDFMPDAKTFHGLPIFPFEAIETTHSPEEYDFFVPMSPAGMNKTREKMYQEVKSKGYMLPSYISSQAVALQAEIGDNCFVLEGSVLQPFAKIGSDVVVWNAHVGHHAQVDNHVFLAATVLCGHVHVENYCFVGAGATVAEGRTLREGTFVGMDASVIADTIPWCAYAGNPAMLQKKSSLEML